MARYGTVRPDNNTTRHYATQHNTTVVGCTGILTSKIGKISSEVAAATRVFQVAEKEYLAAKARKEEAEAQKRLLTEHLAVIIQESEERKEEKLRDLMSTMANRQKPGREQSGNQNGSTSRSPSTPPSVSSPPTASAASTPTPTPLSPTPSPATSAATPVISNSSSPSPPPIDEDDNTFLTVSGAFSG
eukprot:TRINITY_DN2846_c3_g1_i2.p1 TRINITY_DN2846_c3_g1~~TRINITY_DN2846_c3_g1_i2.p1  ORF type:complete len:188 (+),score=39.42 TRINITY_DN2846_c3_g1_i2:121-684(+)